MHKSDGFHRRNELPKSQESTIRHHRQSYKLYQTGILTDKDTLMLQIKKNFEKEISNKENKIKYRTDKPIYSRYSKNEKKLIGKIYTAISNAIADERLREALISNIEDQITK